MADPVLDSILLPVGTLLGGAYRVEGALGKPGGFGITYLAHDVRLDAKVAVKEFFPRGLARRSSAGLDVVPTTPDDRDGFDHARTRFLDEARLLARFHHPAIVRVRTFFEENGTAYLVMDYLEGRTLMAHLERAGGRVGVDTALAIARPLLDALEDLHEAGVLHRDVDPHNVYVTNKQQVVLLDFGAARQAVAEAEGGQRSLSVVLKPGYAPYEQYASKGRQGPWTDLYALSAMLYRMLGGVVPQESTERIAQDELRPLDALVRERYGETIPPEVARAVMWGLALRPEDRPQTAEAFRKALLGEAPTPAPRILTPPPIPEAAPASDPAQTVGLSGSGYAPAMPAPHGGPAAYGAGGYAPAPSNAYGQSAYGQGGYAQGGYAPTAPAPHGGPAPYAGGGYGAGGYASPEPPSYTPAAAYAPSYMADPPKRSAAGPVIAGLLVLAALGGGFYVLTQRPGRAGAGTEQTDRTTTFPSSDPDPVVPPAPDPVPEPPADNGTFAPGPAADPARQDPPTAQEGPKDKETPSGQDSDLADSTPPRALLQSAPVYPEAAAAQGLEGRVLVRVVVSASGAVEDATVESSTDPIFDAAALKAVAQWTFEPATRGGQPVEATVMIPFDFNLN